MQVIMSMKEYEELKKYKEKYCELLKNIKVNYISFEKNIIDENNPITIDVKRIQEILKG
jgi:hypothetical protein